MGRNIRSCIASPVKCGIMETANILTNKGWDRDLGGQAGVSRRRDTDMGGVDQVDGKRETGC